MSQVESTIVSLIVRLEAFAAEVQKNGIGHARSGDNYQRMVAALLSEDRRRSLSREMLDWLTVHRGPDHASELRKRLQDMNNSVIAYDALPRESCATSVKLHRQALIDDVGFTVDLLREHYRYLQGATGPVGYGKQAGDFTPTDADLLILEALGKRKTRCKAGTLGVRGVGEGLKKKRLPTLEAAGLVDRGEGERSGWAITAKGRTLSAPNAHVART